MDRIPDHQQRAVARLIEQYRGRVSYQDVVRLMTAEHQVLEDEVFALYAQVLDSTIGPDLDVWGKLVGQARIGNQADDVYRVWIKARLIILRSGGDGDTIIQLLQMVLPTNQVQLVEEYPAAFRVIIAGGPPMIVGAGGLLPAMLPAPLDPVGDTAFKDRRLIPSLLRSAKAAGVRVVIDYETTLPAEIFHLDLGPGLDEGYLADAASTA